MSVAAAVEGRPVVGLVATSGTTAAARPLVAALARRVTIAASSSQVRAPDALVLTHPDAVTGRVGCPRAVVVGDGVEVRDAEGRMLGDPLVRPGPDAVATATLPPLAPHVRRRWRARLGLAPDLVVDTLALHPVDVPTALAVAAAAVVDRRDLPQALALGCPTVTDAGSAAAVGARPDRDLVVGDRSDAVALAADEVRAARLSRHARALAMARLDPEVTAATILRRWGLDPATGPVDRVDAALADLGTAAGAPARARVADALALFAPSAEPRSP